MHSTPESTALILGALALIFVSAKLGGVFISRFSLPSVLGELGMGILLGLVFGQESLFQKSHVLHVLGEIGVVLLLFEIGLESELKELTQVGFQAAVVAVVGIVLPVAFGVGVSYAFFRDAGTVVHLFTGATLAATSIGLTMRILRDLELATSSEAKIVLGAAVLDDILGLVLLAMVTSLATATANGTSVPIMTLLQLFGKLSLYLLITFVLGKSVVPLIMRSIYPRFGSGSVLIFGISICLAYCYMADKFGLAPVIGAFFAGLSIRAKDYSGTGIGEGPLQEQLHSVCDLFVPLFFVLTGTLVDLSVFLNPSAMGFAAVLTTVAVLGKVLSGYSVGKPLNRLLIGVSMVPRGEVGLIFASMGRTFQVNGKPLLSDATFGAVVVMVAVTSVISPLWLGAMLRVGKAAEHKELE